MRIYYKNLEGKLVKIFDPKLREECNLEEIIKQKSNELPYELTAEMQKNLITIARTWISARTDFCYFILLPIDHRSYAEIHHAPRKPFENEQENEGRVITHIDISREVEEGVGKFIKRLITKFWVKQAEYNLDRLLSRTVAQGIPVDCVNDARYAVCELSAICD